MNVLILTPDAVGSTLLQRMLTIYMQFHAFDRPVINLHELTNGLAKYYSPEFNRELVGKKTVENRGYYQTLSQIVEMLSSVDHYKTSRLAHYHIRRRGDAIDQQVPFYQYLNENFYIIACKRTNVFEHALSMALNKITKKLNVFDAYQKIDTFYEIYKSGILLDPEVFVRQLDAYKLYLDWSEQHFDIGSYFNYEQDIPRLEQYILDLPVFSQQSNLITWDKNFGISFNDWNKMHYAISDVTMLESKAENDLKKLVLEKCNQVEFYQQNAPEEWPTVSSIKDLDSLPAEIKQQWTHHIIRYEGVISLFSQERQQMLSQYKHGYVQAQKTIDQMIDLGIIVNGPPIKKQTLVEKKKIIKNFNQLVDLYNSWASKNLDVAPPMSEALIADAISQESQFWNLATTPTVPQPVLLST